MDAPEKSSNARAAAILALAAVFVVVLVLIASAGGGGDSGGSPAGSGSAKPAKHSHRKIYVVKPGDTFSRIAQKVGISVAKLQRLNPHIDQFTLQSGDRVKLR